LLTLTHPPVSNAHLAWPEHGTTRLRNALNSTPHTYRMDISVIPDSKVVTECAT
jgi:hypothetical protein